MIFCVRNTFQGPLGLPEYEGSIKKNLENWGLGFCIFWVFRDSKEIGIIVIKLMLKPNKKLQ